MILMYVIQNKQVEVEGNHIIENVSSMYILGVAFNNNLINSTPVNDCI